MLFFRARPSPHHLAASPQNVPVTTGNIHAHAGNPTFGKWEIPRADGSLGAGIIRFVRFARRITDALAK